MASAEEPFNYFNYFTEVEERFQQARGTALFLMSPLDWALVETWKDQGIPLEAVLKGIDDAFDKWRQKKSKTQQVNSIAYCAQAVLEAARRLEAPATPSRAVDAPFTAEELRRMLSAAQGRLPAGFESIRESLQVLVNEADIWLERLEELEQRLTSLEEKMFAVVRAECSENDLLVLRQVVEAQIKPYRAKMSAADLMMTQKKFLDQRLAENRGLPRLSLFYLSA